MSDVPQKVAVHRLKLQNFRNYSTLDVAFNGAQHVVLTGHNGAGKTNILEALSLLSPGRGLRRAAYPDMACVRQETDGFSAFYQLSSPLYDEVEIGTGLKPGDSGRRVRINGAPSAADELSDYCRITWLIPAQDGLFAGSAGDRRRFLDRMVLAIDPAHGRHVNDYEKAMRSRNRLLHEGSRDSALLSAFEKPMAELGVAIAAGRVELIRLLGDMVDQLDDKSPFPKADFRLDGRLEAEISRSAALDVEEAFRNHLARTRSLDAASGRTLEGPHRTDLLVFHRKKNMKAALCSTGEQKALLTGLVLAHARLVGSISGLAPILLLDEMAAHLDEMRRSALFDILDELNSQAFLAGTDAALFSALSNRAQFFNVADGSLTPFK